MKRIVLALAAFLLSGSLTAPNSCKVRQQHHLSRQASMRNPDGVSVRSGDSSAAIDEQARVVRHARAPKMHARKLGDATPRGFVPLRDEIVLPVVKGALSRPHDGTRPSLAAMAGATTPHRSPSPARSRVSSDASDISDVSSESVSPVGSRRSSVAGVFAADDAALRKATHRRKKSVSETSTSLFPSLTVPLS